MSKYIGFIIIPLLVGHAFIKRKKDFIFFAKTLAIIPAIYFLNYLPIFLKPNALVVFVNLHIAILHLYRSYLPNYPWGEIWRLLAFGQWRVWFGESEFLKVREWNVFWPLTLVGIFWSIFSFRHFKNEAQIIVFLFAFLYLITNSFHVIFPRHLLTFLPFGYILLILSAKKITERILILNKKVSS